MALQRVRAMEALNADRQVQNCNSGLLKVHNDSKSSHHGVTTTKKDQKGYISFEDNPFQIW